MEQEPKVLIDTEMTKLVCSYTKGGVRAQKNRYQEWLDFTEQAFEMENGACEKFIGIVNIWLKKHRIPIRVLNFVPCDTEIGGTDWTVEILS
jgi:hypothetical protein